MYDTTGRNFNNIYNAYYKKSFLFVKSYLHDDLAAEDIVSDSLIKLWERMKTDPVVQIGPFLFTILKNRSLDYLKHQGVKRDVHESLIKALNRELEVRMFSLESSDPKEIFSTEVQQIIETTLLALPERTREIFVMSRFQNKSHKEIANFFDITVKGVDYHILQSVKELRSALKDYLPFIGIITFLQ